MYPLNYEFLYPLNYFVGRRKMSYIIRPVGRPPVADEDRRSKTIHARITEESYAEMVKIVKNENISVSTFVQTIIDEAIKEYADRERYGDDGRYY